MSESRVRENRTHGSIGGRWRHGDDLRGLLVPGRRLEHAVTLAWSGPQPQRHAPPNQRPTSPPDFLGATRWRCL